MGGGEALAVLQRTAGEALAKKDGGGARWG